MVRLRPGIYFAVLALAWAVPARADISFVHDVAPVLLRRCAGCHGDKINLGGYRANTFRNLMKAGGSGLSPVVPGSPERSKLYTLISTSIAALRMPKGDDPVPAEQVSLIKRWIVEGARFDGADVNASLASAIGPRPQPPAPAVYRSAAPVLAISIEPGSADHVAVGGYHEVTFWDARSGTLLRRIGGLPQRIRALAFNKSGDHILVAGGTPGEYGELALVDIRKPNTVPRVVDTFADLALTVAFSPDGARFGVGCTDGSVHVYDTRTLKAIWTSAIHSDWVTCIAFSLDGRFVASSSKDMTVKLHNAVDGTLYTTYGGHCRQLGAYKGQDPVYSVCWVPGSTDAASAGGGKWIQMWDPDKTKEENGSASDMEERFAKQGHAKYLPHAFKEPVLAMVASGPNLFAASADGTVKQFDVVGMKEIRAYTGHTDWIYALDYDAASHRLVTGSYDGNVKIWDARTGACACTFSAMPGIKSVVYKAR